MSTTRISIHDLLRITYTYEAMTWEEEARSRSSSICSTPDSCASTPPTPSSKNFDSSTLETDYTNMYKRRK